MKMNGAEFDRQFAAATKRGRMRQHEQPLVESVRLIADRGVEIGLSNGCLVRVPLRQFPELRQATSRQLRNVEILGIGQAIHWPDLDQQYDLSALLLDVFGSHALASEFARRGGATRSAAKAAASRANGAKGGRPRAARVP